MISSTVNKQVKYVNALVKKARTRREEDLFVAEGLRMCQEIPKDRIRTLFVSESFRETPECRSLIRGVRQVETVTDQVFQAMSDTRTPQGILALVRQYHYTLDQVAKTGGGGGTPAHLMILETLQDPGNLGTILRAGEGAGVTGILMDATTADIYSPKVIRSTMGSVLRVPFVCVEDLSAAMDQIRARGIRIYAAHMDGGNAYDREDYRGDVAFLIGNEGSGLSEAALARADRRIHIPMAGQVESLNAAVAASVLMFEAARQRRP